MKARRSQLLTAVAILAAVMSAACSSNSGGATQNKTLVIDTSFSLKTADPQRSFEATGFIVGHALYDTLLKFHGSDDTKAYPDVASGYTASPDGRRYTFNLRKDVKFTDGTPLTAADVAFSFNRMINLHGSPSFLLDGVTVSAPDDSTVVLSSKDPNPAIPYIVPNPALGIVNSRVVKHHGGSDQPGADRADTADTYLNGVSAGSGAYTLAGFSTTSQVTLKANPNYWGSGKPTFQTVVIRNVEAPAQLIDVQKGSNEVALDLSLDQAVTLNGNSAVQVRRFASPNVVYTFANADPSVSRVTSNPHIQTAIRYGIDYRALLAIAGAGSVQAPGIVPRGYLGALPASASVKRDVERAKREIAASGITRPSIDLEFATDFSVNGLSLQTLAEKIKANLDEVGIAVNLTGGPAATTFANFRAGKEQMGVWYWGPDYPDPSDYLVFMPGQLVGKRAGWPAGSDPTIEQMAASVGSITYTADRSAVYEQIQTRLNQSGPFMPLLQPGQVIVGSRALTNLVYSPERYVIDDLAAVGTK